MAAKVEIYTWSSCPFCIRAKGLLKKKGVEFTEYAIDGDEQAREKMAHRGDGDDVRCRKFSSMRRMSVVVMIFTV